MSIDNRPFIETHEKPIATPEEVRHRKAYGIASIVLVALMFSGLFVYIQFWSDLGDEARNVAAMAIVAGLVTAFFVYRVLRLYARRDDECKYIYKVLEYSRSARLIVDVHGKTLFSNSQFRELCLLNDKPAKREIDTLEMIFSKEPDSLQKFLWLKKRAAEGHEDTIEVLYREGTRDHWFVILAQPIKKQMGAVHWSIDDMTEKYKVDRAIREEREKLIDFTDNAPVGFFSLDEKGRFIFANATFARWMGQDLKKLLKGGTLHQYLVNPPKDANPYDLTEDGGARQVGEIRMKGAAGQTFLASINQVVVHENEDLIRTRAVVHDLTSEREMRRALKASQDRFETFFAEAPMGIVQIDASRIVVDCNEAFADMMGSTPSKMEGSNFTMLINPDHRRDITKTLDTLADNRDIRFPVETWFKSDEFPIVAQMYGRRLGDEGNIVLHFIDVTDKKVLEEQFVQSQKMQAVGQLAGGVAHDFNNLLTAIIGFSDLLLMRHKPGDPSFSDIMQIKQNSNRAANLVRQLLAFSRQQTLRVKVQDITDILIELSHLTRRLIGAGIEFDLVHGRNLGLVKVDEGQMEQVLINLSVNARDAMGDQGVLTIETENFTNDKPVELISEDLPAGEWVRITVRDNGHGIDKKNMTRIFEPFFTTKDVGEGTGLGLATVYGIIRQTDGFLDVQSTKNKGTTFSIYLPVAELEPEDENEKTEKVKVETKDLTGSECILLVEDEDAVRTFSERALTNKGYHVMTAASGEMALDVLKENAETTPDLVITDVVMPGMDGPTLAQRLRQENKDLKIIFVSGYTEDKLAGHMVKNTYFIPKPYTLKVLAEKVKDVLEA